MKSPLYRPETRTISTPGCTFVYFCWKVGLFSRIFCTTWLSWVSSVFSSLDVHVSLKLFCVSLAYFRLSAVPVLLVFVVGEWSHFIFNNGRLPNVYLEMGFNYSILFISERPPRRLPAPNKLFSPEDINLWLSRLVIRCLRCCRAAVTLHDYFWIFCESVKWVWRVWSNIWSLLLIRSICWCEPWLTRRRSLKINRSWSAWGSRSGVINTSISIYQSISKVLLVDRMTIRSDPVCLFP